MANLALPLQDLSEILDQAHPAFETLRHSRIFITGGTGFFGHWLLESLLHADRALALDLRVTALTRSASRFRAISPHLAAAPALTLLEGDIQTFPFPVERYTHIVHAATDSGGQQLGRPAYELAEAILEGTRHTLTFARETGAHRLLYTSTGAIYGRSSSVYTHTPETCLAGPDPLSLQSSYDEAKRMSEHLCVAYSEGARLETVVARPFAFIGPHLPLDQHFAIGNFLGSAIAGKPITIRGDGTPLRSWMYMSDLAAWLWTLLARGERNRAYNVGSEEAFTIGEAARVTSETLRPGLPITIAGHANPGQPMNSYVPSTARAREELGLRATIDLREALRRSAAWHGFSPSQPA